MKVLEMMHRVLSVRTKSVLFKKYSKLCNVPLYEGWNFNSGNYLFTTDTK